MADGKPTDRWAPLRARTLEALADGPSTCRDLAQLLLGEGRTRTTERARMRLILVELEKRGSVKREIPKRPPDNTSMCIPDIWSLPDARIAP